MKTNRPLHFLLAAIAVASLLTYVLACSTAFSPDDRQLLYPSFDPQSGALSIALYDRSHGRSEQIFSSLGVHSDTNLHSACLRAEWLPDGRHILIAEASDKENVSLFVLARGGKEPIRHLVNLKWDQALTALEFPFAIIGNKVYLNDEHRLIRVDWVTGALLINSNSIAALPGNDGHTLLGWHELSNNGADFGVIDPQTLVFNPQLRLTNRLDSGVFPAFHPAQNEIMFVSGSETNQELQIERAGVKIFSRPITRPGGEVKIAGPWLEWEPGKDRVFTLYTSRMDQQTNYECGLLEIPLTGKPLRFTPLFHTESEDLSMLAQPSLSHDGRIWAISSAWLGGRNRSALESEDCALFLVRLDQDPPRFTKVPISLPTVADEGLN